MPNMESDTNSASLYWGMNLRNLPKRQQQMLISIWKYREGWLSESDLDTKLEEIYRKK